MGCSVTARYTPSTMTASREDLGYVLTQYSSTFTNPDIGQRVIIDPFWARYLNAYVPQLNSTVFAQLATTTSLWDANSSSISNSSSNVAMTEAILSALVANGLSRMSHNLTIVGDLKVGLDRTQWASYMLPSGFMGEGGDVFNASSLPTLRSQWNVTGSSYGYAYS